MLCTGDICGALAAFGGAELLGADVECGEVEEGVGEGGWGWEGVFRDIGEAELTSPFLFFLLFLVTHGHTVNSSIVFQDYEQCKPFHRIPIDPDRCKQKQSAVQVSPWSRKQRQEWISGSGNI